MSNSEQAELVHLMETRSELDEKEFRKRLDQIVGDQRLGWEMGPDPGDEATTKLSFSLQSSRELAEELSSRFGLPIKKDDWCVDIGIPPRLWDKHFEYTSPNGREYLVEGKNWQFRMARDERGAAIELVPDILIAPSDEDDIAQVLIVGEIGERNLLDFVSYVTVSTHSVNQFQPMENFRAEFSQLFPNCHYMNVFVRH